jgi:hypothetical protein
MMARLFQPLDFLAGRSSHHAGFSMLTLLPPVMYSPRFLSKAPILSLAIYARFCYNMPRML